METRRITSVNFVDSLGGKTPARVNRLTGEMFIDKNLWSQMTDNHREFVYLHEEGHVVLNTTNEYEADAYAFDKYAKQGRSLREGIKALTRVLSFSGANQSEHVKRTLALLKQAQKFDRNNNWSKGKFATTFFRNKK